MSTYKYISTINSFS